VQYGFQLFDKFQLLSKRIKYKSDHWISLGWFLRASIIALCSAWTQHVLSVTFLWYEFLSQVHLLWDSKSLGGVFHHCQIILSSFTIIHPHLDLSQVAFLAIFQAIKKYFSAVFDASQANISIFVLLY
jgi:hypothetical protein